jgi:hypothetical protein
MSAFFPVENAAGVNELSLTLFWIAKLSAKPYLHGPEDDRHGLASEPRSQAEGK